MERIGRVVIACAAAVLALAAAASAGVVAGTVRDSDGRPFDGVTVRAFSLDRAAGHPSVQTTTDAGGRYRIEGVHEGTNEITVQSLRKGDNFAVRVATVEVGGEPVKLDVRLPKTELTGRITLAEDAAAPAARRRQPSIGVYVLEKREGRERLGSSIGMAFAEEDGRYRFRGFAPGRYRLIVNLVGYRTAERDLTLKSGPNGGIDFALERKVSGLVRFTVVDGEGEPVEGATFSVSLGEVSRTVIVTGGDDLGVYETRELEVGAHEVAVGRDGYEFARATVKVEKDRTTEVRIVLQKKP